jgi:hypothetical protein
MTIQNQPINLSDLGYTQAQVEALKNLKPNPNLIISEVTYSEKSEVLRKLMESINK